LLGFGYTAAAAARVSAGIEGVQDQDLLNVPTCDCSGDKCGEFRKFKTPSNFA
jgi:hypothetical protein